VHTPCQWATKVGARQSRTQSDIRSACIDKSLRSQKSITQTLLDEAKMGSLSNHEDLLARIRGQTIILPDFRPILAKWPTNLNPNYSFVREEADQRLKGQIIKMPFLVTTIVTNTKWIDYFPIRRSFLL
jgi:hypothetical protein